MINTFSGTIQDIAVGIYDGPHATPPESGDGPIFLGIENLTAEGRVDFSKVRHISEQHFPEWTRRVVPKPGDIVFSYEATLHRYGIIPEGFRGCLGRRLALIRPDTSKVDNQFLFYYLLSPKWRGVVESNIITGATVDRVPLKNFPSFPVQMPALDIQKRIASILSSYDDLIENNRRRIELLEQASRLLYKEWFVHFRFPGHEHVKIVDGVPEGWENTIVPGVIEINPKESTQRGNSVRYIPMSSLSETGMTIGTEEVEIRENPTSVRFRNGDVLLARITPCLENGKTAFVNILDKDEVACGSTEFIVMRGKQVSPYFTYCFARTEELRGHAINSMIGSSGRQRVQVSAFRDYQVAIPPRDLLESFDEFAFPCFKQIEILQRENAHLKKARDLLLPRLMNGEIAI